MRLGYDDLVMKTHTTQRKAKKRDATLCIRLSAKDKARLKSISDVSECSTSDLVVKAIQDMMDSLEGLSKKGHTHWNYPHQLPKPKPRPLAWFSDLFSR